MTGADLTQLVGPALASALATKGYDTLTPVQEAVLDDGLGSRDSAHHLADGLGQDARDWVRRP